MKHKLIIRDFLLNIVATCLPVMTLQLLILPGIASKDGEAAYGLIVTLLGIITIGSETVGNSLNNTRLLQQMAYEEKGLEGDFNRILIYGCLGDILIVSVGVVYYHGALSDLPLTLVAAVLVLLRMYYIVAYRLQIDYKGMFINSILLSVGYMTGYYIYLQTDEWTLIYIIGNLISLGYIFFTTDIMRESLSTTILFKDTCRRMGGIYAADIMKTVMSYADRLIIFPVLGAVIVADYYVASIIGKMISMAVFPVGSVILSYIVKMDEFDKKRLIRMGVLLMVLSVPAFFIILFGGRIMVGYLYPSMYDDVKGIMYLTSASALLLAITSLVQPLVLRFRGVRYQLYISIICLVLYLTCSLIGIRLNGITGFCLSYCMVLFLRMILYLIGLARV